MNENVDKTVGTTENGNRLPGISLRAFLETVHPSVSKAVTDFWDSDLNINSVKRRNITFPDIRLHCKVCGGERTFRCDSPTYTMPWNTDINIHPRYTCGDCRVQRKTYSLNIKFGNEDIDYVYKYGEIPPFGIPVSNRLLRLFGGTDAELFKKGRQCENQGFGIAAFAYYRRVVENHKNDLFEEIIKVCNTIGVSSGLIQELEAAKKEVSFKKSMAVIKAGLPDGLLISGHNPLSALHSALSIGLHSESDEECLENAQAVRVVLSELIDRISNLKKQNSELTNAVQLLISKKSD